MKVPGTEYMQSIYAQYVVAGMMCLSAATFRQIFHMDEPEDAFLTASQDFSEPVLMKNKIAKHTSKLVVLLVHDSQIQIHLQKS